MAPSKLDFIDASVTGHRLMDNFSKWVENRRSQVEIMKGVLCFNRYDNMIFFKIFSTI